MESWTNYFDARQRSEIAFCRIYAQEFAHGTMGHNLRLIVAHMADLLDKLSVKLAATKAIDPHLVSEIESMGEMIAEGEMSPEEAAEKLEALVSSGAEKDQGGVKEG